MSLSKLSATTLTILLTMTLSGVSNAGEREANQAERGGSHGSGTDGLTYEPPKNPPGEVVLKLPGEMSDFGFIKMIGTPGPGQPDSGVAIRCEVAANGFPKKGGCQNPVWLPLNQPVELRSGFYLVVYSNTVLRQLVEVEKGRTKPIPLIPVRLPPEKVGAKFRLYKDVAAAEERAALLEWFWSYTSGKFREPENYKLLSFDTAGTALSSTCPGVRANPTAHQYCEMLRAAQAPEDFLRLFKFNPEPKHTSYLTVLNKFIYLTSASESNTVYSEPIYPLSVSDTFTDSFISVLPGTYVIEFVARDGYTTYHPGYKIPPWQQK